MSCCWTWMWTGSGSVKNERVIKESWTKKKNQHWSWTEGEEQKLQNREERQQKMFGLSTGRFLKMSEFTAGVDQLWSLSVLSAASVLLPMTSDLQIHACQSAFSGTEVSLCWLHSSSTLHRQTSGSGSSTSFGELLEWIFPISSRALARESRSVASWCRASHRLRMTAEGLCCLAKKPKFLLKSTTSLWICPTPSLTGPLHAENHTFNLRTDS